MKQRKRSGSGKRRKAPVKLVFDQKKEVRAIARERVGPVKASQTIQPKVRREKPKHKGLLEEMDA
jgi:hypothetical protein